MALCSTFYAKEDLYADIDAAYSYLIQDQLPRSEAVRVKQTSSITCTCLSCPINEGIVSLWFSKTYLLEENELITRGSYKRLSSQKHVNFSKEMSLFHVALSHMSTGGVHS